VRPPRTLPRPFLDITDRVNCCGERGLLGLAFPPGFADKQRFYIYYTDSAGNLALSRFQVSADPDLADASSETVLLSINHQPFDNHNGGHLAFGPNDGYLYIGTGDGGGGGDTLGSGQNLSSLRGKLLRIDVESGAAPYAIPATNPFVNLSSFPPRDMGLWIAQSMALSFDRAGGDLYIGDVGQDAWEEVDFQPASSPGGEENYGWNLMEGNHCYQTDCSSAGPDPTDRRAQSRGGLFGDRRLRLSRSELSRNAGFLFLQRFLQRADLGFALRRNRLAKIAAF